MSTPQTGVPQPPTAQQKLTQWMARQPKSRRPAKSPGDRDKERQWKATRAGFLLSGLSHDVMAQVGSWEMAARNVGTAYADASSKHTAALAKQDKIDALKTQALFSVLTVASSGALSWLVSGLDLATVYPERKVLIDVLKDTGQAGIGEGFSAVSPMVFSQQNESVNIDPPKFQNQRENAVTEARIKADHQFSMISQDWAKKAPEDWDAFDDRTWEAIVKSCLDAVGELAGAEDLKTADEMSEVLERGFWAKWMPGLKTVRWMTTAKDDMRPEDLYQGVGSAIEERFETLGILKAANVEIHWYQRASTEDQKLIAWAQRYTQKPESLLKAKAR